MESKKKITNEIIRRKTWFLGQKCQREIIPGMNISKSKYYYKTLLCPYCPKVLRTEFGKKIHIRDFHEIQRNSEVTEVKIDEISLDSSIEEMTEQNRQNNNDEVQIIDGKNREIDSKEVTEENRQSNNNDVEIIGEKFRKIEPKEVIKGSRQNSHNDVEIITEKNREIDANNDSDIQIIEEKQ